MFKALIPIIGILVAVGLFFTYIQPTFKDIKAIQDEAAQYAQATAKAAELQQRINELKQQQSSISLVNLERLEALLPHRVDEVSVLIDIDALATLHNLTLGDIEVGAQQNGSEEGRERSVNTQGENPLNEGPLNAQITDAARNQYSTLDISFSVSGSYNDFRAFLQDIERSLVLMEVAKITFSRSESEETTDTMQFMLHVQLFSLNPTTQ